MKIRFQYVTCHLILLLPLAAFCQSLQGNSMLTTNNTSLKCTYRITFRSDSTSKDTRVEYAQLLIGKNLSKFETIGSQKIDSVRSTFPDVLTAANTNPQDYIDKMLSLPQTKFHYLIYKTVSTERIYCYDRIGNVMYNYIEPESKFKWVISPEKTIIAGYECQQASTKFAGRIFKAWFTREIPISEGPYKFYGLPGLIVKIYDADNYYSFELVKLYKTTIPPISLPTKKTILTTKAAFRKGQAAYDLEIATRASQIGNDVTAAERRRMTKPITPIELH